MKERLTIAAAVVAAATLACQEEGNSGAGLRSEVRDSAGKQIVDNAEPPEGSRLGWTIGPRPTVSIGVLEGEEPYMLYRAYDAATLSDGRIVVANTGTQELRVFDRSGTHLATWGGEGQGPGEFTDLSQIEAWPGDSIIAWYGPQLGFSVFGPDGSHGRNFVFAGQERVSPMQRFWPAAASRDGLILARHGPEAADTMVMQLRNGDGEVLASFGTHPSFEWHLLDEGDRSILFQKTFGGEPVWALRGDQVVIGHTGRYELKSFAGDGTLARIIRRDHRQRVPTAAEVGAYIENEMDRNIWATGAAAVALRRRFAAVPVAEHLPAFTSIMTDALGHLWVEEYESPADPRPVRLWTVFDPDGRVLGFVETPKGLSIDEVGADYVLGTALSDLDVEMVQVWPLGRSESRE